MVYIPFLLTPIVLRIKERKKETMGSGKLSLSLVVFC